MLVLYCFFFHASFEMKLCSLVNVESFMINKITIS